MTTKQAIIDYIENHVSDCYPVRIDNSHFVRFRNYDLQHIIEMINDLKPKVKKLEWEEDTSHLNNPNLKPDSKFKVYHAKNIYPIDMIIIYTAINNYSHRMIAQSKLIYKWVLIINGLEYTDCDNLVEVKIMAQKYYEQYILGQIESGKLPPFEIFNVPPGI